VREPTAAPHQGRVVPGCVAICMSRMRAYKCATLRISVYNLYMVEDWSVEKVSASTAIERGSVGFESTDNVQRVTKAASKQQRRHRAYTFAVYRTPPVQ